ncbi:MAG: hypothetical protein WCE75_03930 [Terracidiphilus sp.]
MGFLTRLFGSGAKPSAATTTGSHPATGNPGLPGPDGGQGTISRERAKAAILLLSLQALGEPKFEGQETAEYYLHLAFEALAAQVEFLVSYGSASEIRENLPRIRQEIEGSGQYSEASVAKKDYELDHPWAQRTEILRQLLDCAERTAAIQENGA